MFVYDEPGKRLQSCSLRYRGVWSVSLPKDSHCLERNVVRKDLRKTVRPSFEQKVNDGIVVLDFSVGEVSHRTNILVIVICVLIFF